MTTHVFAPILGRRIRVTQVDGTGTVVSTAKKVVTDGFINIKMTAQIEAGTEIIQRNAAGLLCINEMLNSSFKRLNVEIEFCGVNPSLAAMVTSAKEYNDYAGDVAGFTLGEGIIGNTFALELWTGISGETADPNANGYFVLPFVNAGNLGDITTDGQNAVTFSMANAFTRGGNSWGVGPYNTVYNNASPGIASKLPTALDPFDHLLVIDTAVAVPPVTPSPVLYTA